ncbi:cartilage intermediate layer protein 1 [Trichomycterus rosablanca]|uniref:cartilage intermediate layer protein 1 n=1 Tax=Trichomycterus rosablanca TaxID=2290929 RepID=UPI002F356E3F
MKWLIFCVILIGSGTLQASSVKKCYTEWFDWDDSMPDNDDMSGDYETLFEVKVRAADKICSSPSSVQAQTLDGVSAETTGQNFAFYDTTTGFICLNHQQKDKKCLDYKVRFECPCPWP